MAVEAPGAGAVQVATISCSAFASGKSGKYWIARSRNGRHPSMSPSSSAMRASPNRARGW